MKKWNLAVLMALASIFLFANATFETKGYQVGDKAMDFNLKNIDGNMVSLKGMSDAKGFIVIFTCNHCPFSVAYEDRIIELNNKYASKGYPVVAVNPNDPTAYPEDSYENMKVRAKEKGFNFPYLLDDTQDIAKTYGASKTPHVFLLKKSGSDLIVEYIGAIDNSKDASGVETKYVESAVDELLQNKKVSKNSTTAIGCGIKWKKS